MQILRLEGSAGPATRVVEVSLREPPPAAVLTDPVPAAPVPAEAASADPLAAPEAADFRAAGRGREAFVVTFEPADGVTRETVVSLASGAVRSSRQVAGVQPAITPAEFAECEAVVRADGRFRAGLRKRGIDDPQRVQVEAWGVGAFTPPELAGRRLAWTLCFYRAEPGDNPYAKPVDGLYAIVDLAAMQVIRVDDLGVKPLPAGRGDYQAERIVLRDDVMPLQVHQPEGVSFTVAGREVTWQRWRFVVGFSPREGLVLHHIRYLDQGRERPVCYRASFAELVIPYADPRPPRSWANAFDIGEYGVGPLTNSLAIGCDCLGQIHYLDADLCDSAGEPYTIPRAICLHEEDAGLLWKHYDADLDHAEVRRARRLAVSSVITVGNYEYAFYWYFGQDGTIEAEVRLTGVMLTSGLAPGEDSPYGTRVADGLSATYHQHFFCVRLHMSVDGTRNTVYEVDTEPVPAGPANPAGNAFVTCRRALRTEQQAQRLIDPAKGRHWLVLNPRSANGLGDPVAYKLVPGGSVLPFAQPGAPILRRAAFATRHLWVTPFDPAERYPAGDYPNQHPGGAGLPEWTRADRPVEDTSLVLWYTLGSLHIPRPEDWPVMPAERAGFALKPAGFFDRNPALDVPPASADGSCHLRDADPP
jgi:primary-amine oxidase